MSWRIHLSPPHMGEDERKLLLDAFDSNWIAPLGPHVNAFEEELAARAGTDQAVALSSGTAALHLALLEVGVEPGDQVVCPTLTFAATANAIHYCNAEPVFVDAEPGRWTLAPALLEAELAEAAEGGRLPAAIVTVDLYGTACDYAPILDLAARYGVPVVEDAAEALGATYDGAPAGSFGQAGVFSFNGNKIITASGGGAVVTDDADLADRVRHLATQAREPAAHYEHREVGYNYRLSNLLAAVGRGQLGHLGDRVARCRAINARYREHLAGLPGVSVHPTDEESTCWLTQIVLEPDRAGTDPTEIRKALAAHDIQARPVWKPIHLQPAFADCRSRGGAVAADLFERGLCLPSGSALTDDQIDEIAGVVRACCASVADS